MHLTTNLKAFYTFLVLCLTISSLSAQFNVKIGYELGYFQSSANKALTDQFNLEKSDILQVGKEMKPLNFMNGLVLGMNYHTKWSRIELSWHTLSSRKEAYGEITEPTPSLYSTELRYKIQGIQLGYEIFYKKLGIGMTIARDAFISTALIPGSNNNKTITNQINYGSKFHISWRLYQSDRIALLFRPYYNVYWGDITHVPIKEYLEVEKDINLIDRPSSFGISVIFLNGEQNKN